jgi:hypothetical protein
MFKYKWTPLQLLALVAISLAIFEFISIANIKGEPGLGGLTPYIFMAFGAGLFIIDCFIQFLLRNSRKAFFICEAVLCLSLVIWIYSIGGI